MPNPEKPKKREDWKKHPNALAIGIKKQKYHNQDSNIYKKCVSSG